MKEVHIEQYLVTRVRSLGGLCIKLAAPGDAGWPDRMVLLPGGLIGFIELKRPGQKPRPLQLHRLAALSALGFIAEWADSFTRVEEFLQLLQPMDYLDMPYPVPA